MEMVNHAVGPDHHLINGYLFHNYYSNSLGHPYFYLDGFIPGSVTLEGTTYDGVMINYDIHKQQVVVEYENMSGGMNQLIMVNDHVDEFRIGPFHFIKTGPGWKDQSPAGFHQVITTEHFSCHVFWEKQHYTTSGSTSLVEQFTEPHRTYYARVGETLGKFRNRRSFAALFPEEDQRKIRRHLRKSHAQFRKVDPASMLINLTELSGMLGEEERP
jgi:hypothetical protein